MDKKHAQRAPHRSRRLGRRGIYLISTLLLLTFLVMLGGAIAVSFQQGLASSGSFNNRQMALGAAMSGLQYIQARLESNPTTYGPDYVAASSQTVVDVNGFKVREVQDAATKGVNICGYLDNSAVAGAGGAKVTLLFRACFNGAYSAYAATPDRWTSIATFNSIDYATAPAVGFGLGAMEYISMNNVLRSSQTAGGNSYRWDGRASHPFKQVPGGTANVFVEGLVVRDDGMIVARRMVECMYGLSGLQSPTAPGAATAALDMNITLYEAESAGGKLTVGVGSGVNADLETSSGLAAYRGNINLTGKDAARSNTAPPAYSSTAKASVLANRALVYSDGTSSTSYSPSTTGQTVVQAQEVPPPAIKPGDLPPLRSPSTLSAGTWVIWNGVPYHYPVEYDPTTPMTKHTWSGGTSGPPSLKIGGGPAVDPDSAVFPSQGMTFDPSTNTVTVKSDVSVEPSSGSNGFALLVAPSQNQPSGSNSADNGSAQIVFEGADGATPQFRSPGSISVLGNVTGAGALVASGLTQSGVSVGAANVTVVGKSSLDPRSDSGVALYASGDVNMLQLSYAQSPKSVPAVKDSLGALGVQEGGGGSGARNNSEATFTPQTAIYAALAQAINGAQDKLTRDNLMSTTANGEYVVKAPQVFAVGVKPSLSSFGYHIQNVKVKVGPYSGELDDVVRQIIHENPSSFPNSYNTLERSLDDRTGVESLTLGNLVFQGQTDLQALRSQNGWTTGNSGGLTGTVSQAVFGNYIDTGTNASSTQADPTATASGDPSGGTTASPSPSASTGGSVTQAALNQSFSGLVYAGGDLNIRNGLGSVTINGMAAAYGGDPTSGPPGQQSGGGSINLSGDSVTLHYNPTTVGPYLYLFGGVKMHITCLSNF